MTSQFQPVEWSYDTNIYEVNLRQYTPEGTFNAFIKHLPGLRDMGIEILWFMPITPISVEKRIGSLGSYYACSDYTSANPEFGSVDEFKDLVKAAHDLGFKVIIDWVANHTGWDHHWTKDHPDFYRKNQDGNFFDAHGWQDVIDLNYDNEDLWKAMISAMQFWVMECDIDGFRCDMAMLVPLDFWRHARKELDAFKKLFWLAECEEIDYHEVFDATYTWKFIHKMEAYWRKETDMGGVDEVLHYYDKMFPQTAFRAFFTTNHDENSHSGSEYERMGNAVKTFAVLCCTWNGLPLIYSGQELPNYKRLKFFDKDLIEWKDHCELHDFYKTLLNLRKRNKALRAGDSAVNTYCLQTNFSDKAFTFLRKCQSGEVLVLLNLSAEQLSLTINDAILDGIFKNSFTGNEVDFSQHKSIDLQPWGFHVFEK